jgi:hypothetical protein
MPGPDVSETVTARVQRGGRPSSGGGAVAAREGFAWRKVHTIIGDALREAVGGGAAWISSATKRGSPGAVIDVPLAHKDALYVRDYYDVLEVRVPDAPLPDEIVVTAAVASRGRLHARCGGLAASEIRGKDGLR